MQRPFSSATLGTPARPARAHLIKIGLRIEAITVEAGYQLLLKARISFG